MAEALPKYLRSTYKQYKKDTAYVTNWLLDSARERGYRPLQMNPGDPVTTGQLVATAQNIASCDNPPIHVPQLVLQTLQHAITAREIHNKYGDPAKKSGHAYFVRTLREILRTLEAIRVEDQDLIDVRSDDSESESEVSVIHLEDPERFEFAASWFFQDLKLTLEHVSLTWDQYVRGETSLVAAAVVNEYAIELARRLEADLLAEFPQIRSAHDLMSVFCAEDNFDEDLASPSFKPGTNSAEKLSDLERAAFCFYPTYRQLAFLLEDFDIKARPTCCPPQAEPVVGEMPCSQKLIDVKIQDDKTLFKELSPLIHWELLYSTQKEDGPGTFDDFLQGLYECLPKRNLSSKGILPKQLSVWLIVAGQCFLEAHHATRAMGPQAYQELRVVVLSSQHSVMKCIDFNEETKVSHAFECFRIQDTMTDADDRPEVDSVQHFIREHLSEEEAPGKFCLLKQSPTRCGIQILSHIVSVQ